LQLAEASGFVPRIGYETDNFTAVLGMVSAGLGVALIPSLALAVSTLPPDVVIRPTANHDHRTIHLVAAPGSDQVPAIAAAASAILHVDAEAWSLTPADA
jgi:DNA-binding transcriptional LysR family regulator